jgi:hypothetical protein
MIHRKRLVHAIVTAVVILLVGCYYWWAIRAAGDGIKWDGDLRGYYNYLGRAFASGQLHLLLEPSRELLALKDPWDPKQNDPYRMHDMVLFGGKYYLYHGAGPAVLLFTPWHMITGHDLPENVAVAVFCFAGFLFYSGALLRAFARIGYSPGPGLLALMLLTLGVGQAVPYLCSRVGVYEVAIAAGFCFTAGGIFFLARGLTADQPVCFLGLSGLMFGIAIACRPHLGVAGAICFAALVVYIVRGGRSGANLGWSGAILYLLAFTACGVMVAAYNYARFGNPFEFGQRYLLGGDVGQQALHLSAANVPPGLYYMLICPPDFSLVFPWVRLALRLPFQASQYALPPGYFLEPGAGALFVAPVLIALAMPVSVKKPLKPLLWGVGLSSIVIVLFVAMTGLTTQRYLVDFVPLALFAALLKLSCERSPAILAAVLAFTIVVNLALAISGPYDDMLANRPASYVRIAGWFSPVEKYRPMMNPSVTVSMDVAFAKHAPGFREPLVTIGGQGARHSIYVEHRGRDLLLVSHSEHNLSPDTTAIITAKPSHFKLIYDPSMGVLSIAIDEVRVIEQPMPRMVTAPSQVIAGGNGLPGFAGEKFTGTIHLIEKTVSRQP